MSETATVPQAPAAPATPAAPTAPATTQELSRVAPAQRERIQVNFNPDDPAAMYMDTGIFEQLQRVASMMANSSLVPAHLRNEPAIGSKPAVNRVGDCFLVVAQAFRWRMDPFAVAQHTFVTKGKLGYEGKLIAGLINSSGKLDGSLRYTHTGTVGSTTRGVLVMGRLKGEKEDRAIEGTVAAWKTENEKWVSMPDQMLVYRGAREWARRHMPEVVLGIQAEDDLEPAVTLTPDGKGRYAAPANLDALTESLAPAPAAAEAQSSEASATPAAAPAESAPPAREPGSDDDVNDEAAARAAVAAVGKAASAKGRQGSL